jgi:hypothetical protein
VDNCEDYDADTAKLLQNRLKRASKEHAQDGHAEAAGFHEVADSFGGTACARCASTSPAQDGHAEAAGTACALCASEEDSWRLIHEFVIAFCGNIPDTSVSTPASAQPRNLKKEKGRYSVIWPNNAGRQAVLIEAMETRVHRQTAGECVNQSQA